MCKLVRTLAWFLSGLGLVAIMCMMPQLASTRDQKTTTLDPRPWPVWQTEQVIADAVSLGLAVDAANRPHILFQLRDDTMLRYGVRQEGGWSFRTVTDLTAGGEQFNLSLDSAGRPHIAYIDGEDGAVIYGVLDGDNWTLSRVTTSDWQVLLDMGDSDTPHLVVTDAGEVTYWSLHNGQWVGEAVAAIGPYQSAWLAIDTQARPHVAYPLPGSSEIAVRTGENLWARTAGPSVGVDGDAMAFVLGPADEPYFLLTESTLIYPRPPEWITDLILAKPSGNEWSGEWVQGILSDHYVLVELLIGSDGRMHLFTVTQYNDHISYQWRNGPDDWRWENPGGYEVFDRTALGPDNQPQLTGTDEEGGLFLKRRTINWLDRHALLPIVVR